MQQDQHVDFSSKACSRELAYASLNRCCRPHVATYWATTDLAHAVAHSVLPEEAWRLPHRLKRSILEALKPCPTKYYHSFCLHQVLSHQTPGRASGNLSTAAQSLEALMHDMEPHISYNCGRQRVPP